MTSTQLSTYLLPLALPGAFLANAHAATSVTAAVNNGDWMAAATWSDNAVPIAGNDYFVPNGIGIDGDARTGDQGNSTRTFAGGSLTIQSGGTLFLDSIHSSSFPTWTYTIPNLTLQNGGNLNVRGSAGTIFTLTNGFAVAADSTVSIRHSAGSYDQRLNLGAITGPSTSTIQIIASQFSTLSGINSKDNYANVANSAYAGNWFLDATATTADRNVRLRADAASALGSGNVTVARKSILENNATGGFDGLKGITLQNDTSQLKFNNRDWTSPAAMLTVANGIAAVGTAHLSIGSINQTGGDINLTVGGSKDGKLIAGGNVDFSGGKINLTYATSPVGKTFDVVTYGGTLGTYPLIVTGDTGRIVGNVNYGSGTNDKITVTYTGTAASLTWLGNEPGYANDWDNNVATNWSNGGNPDKFNNYDNVTFGNTTGSTTPNLLVTLIPGSVTFNHSTNDYSLGGTGSIAGTGALTKSGTGSLTITPANSYTGGTTLNAGKIRIGNNAALGTGSLTVNGGAVSSDGTTARTLALPLVLNGALTVADATDSGAITFSSGATLASNATLTVPSGTSVANALNGVITDGANSFSITKEGVGSISFNSANTYDGGTTLNAGRIRIANNAALGTGTITVNGGAISSDGTTARTIALPLLLNGAFTIADATDSGAITFSNGATLAANATLTVPTGTGVANALNGLITDGASSYSITKEGVGSINFNSANTYDGGTSINAGRLACTNVGALGTAAVSVANGACAYFSAAGTIANNFTLAGDGWVEGSGTLGALRLGGGNSATGTITLAANARITAYSSTGTIAGNIGQTGGARKLELGGTGFAASGGTITVSGNNSHSGGTDVSNATVVANTNTAFGSGAVVMNGAERSARIQLGNGVNIANSLTADANAGASGRGILEVTGTNSATWSGPITFSTGVTAGGHLFTDTGATLTLSGGITAPGEVVQRAGNVVISGGGSCSAYQLTGGLKLADNNGVPTNANLKLGVSGAGTFNLNGYNQTVAQLTRTGNTNSVLNNGTTPSVLTIDNTVDHTLTNSTLSNGTGGLSLVKKGSGTFTLSAASTYTGGTSVEGGKLVVVGTTGAAPVTVAAAGTLGGVGPIAGTVAVNGTIAPGNPAGTLVVNNTVTFGPGSSYAWEVADWTGATAGTSWDLLNSSTLAFTATPANKLTIAISGTAANFTESAKTFKIAGSTNPITGFNPAAIQINDSAFIGNGTWSVQLNGNSVELVYAAGSGNPFTTWASSHGIPANPADDSDRDGIPAAIEFVIGGNPGSDSSALLPTITTDTDYLYFTYRRTDDAAGMPEAQQPYVQYGSNLTGWTTAEGGENGVLISEVNGTPDLVTVKIPRSLAATTGKLFARLRVDIE